jgi:DNA-binding transcriptional regulator YiaG
VAHIAHESTMPSKPVSHKPFSEELKEARKAVGLTQGEAADILRVAKRALQHWEDGDREPIYPAQLGALIILRGYRASASSDK